MTVHTAYAIQADSYSAEIFRDAVASLLPPAVGGLQNGVGGVVSTGDLVVTGSSGANSVKIAAGQCWVPGSVGSSQALYYAYNDAQVILAITPNASNPLIALVTMSVNDQAYSGNPGVTNNTAGLLVTQGTPASSPVAPAVPANSLLLATVLVPANASNGSTYTITDGRTSTSALPSGRMYPTAGTALTTGVSAVVGSAGTSMATDFLEGGMTFSNANSELIVPQKAIYSCSWQVTFGGSGGGALSATGPLEVYLVQSGTAIRQSYGYASTAAGTPSVPGFSRVSLPAGAALQLAALQGTGSAQRAVLGSEFTWLDVTMEQLLP